MVFNGKRDFVLKAAINALNNDCLKEEPFDAGLNHKVSCITVIELYRYKSLRELVDCLVRIKLGSPTASVLLVNTKSQLIPPLKSGAVSISASVLTWKRVLSTLKKGSPNIDYIVNECFTLINRHHLSPKQNKVIDHLGEGMSLDEIARHLCISVKAIYACISNASTKYGFLTNKKFQSYILSETAAHDHSSISIIPPHLSTSDCVYFSSCA